MNSTWKWDRVGDLLLICATEGNLVDADFDPCLELHRKDTVVRAVMWGVGNIAMSAAQRKKAGEAMRDHPSANVTDSAITRGVITAFAWMGKPWRAYASRELRQAIRHVGVPTGSSEDEIYEKLQVLRAKADAEARQPATASR